MHFASVKIVILFQQVIYIKRGSSRNGRSRHINGNIQYQNRIPKKTNINQTYKNINLLISDDCSPNKEVEKTLEEYAKKDKRIKIYKTEHNLGYTKNFEYLLQKSTSKYICFSDHDDIWYPQKIEKSLEKLKKDDVDLVYCNCHQIDENDQIIKQDYFKYKNMPLIKKHSKLAISRYAGIGC